MKPLMLLGFIICVLTIVGCKDDAIPLGEGQHLKTLSIESDHRISLNIEGSEETLVLSRTNGEIVFKMLIDDVMPKEFQFASDADEKFNLFHLYKRSSPGIEIQVQSYLDLDIAENDEWYFLSSLEEDQRVSELYPMFFNIETGMNEIEYFQIITPTGSRKFNYPTVEDLQGIRFFLTFPTGKIFFVSKRFDSEIWEGMSIDYEIGTNASQLVEVSLEDFQPLQKNGITVDENLSNDIQIIVSGLDKPNAFDPTSILQRRWILRSSRSVGSFSDESPLGVTEVVFPNYEFENYLSKVKIYKDAEIHEQLAFGEELPDNFSLESPIVTLDGDINTGFQVSGPTLSGINTFLSNWRFYTFDSSEGRYVQVLWQVNGEIGKDYFLPDLSSEFSEFASYEISFDDIKLSTLGESNINELEFNQNEFYLFFKNELGQPVTNYYENILERRYLIK